MIISRVEMLDPYYYINKVRQFSKHSFEEKIQALDTIAQDLQKILFNDDRRADCKADNRVHPEKRSCRDFCCNDKRDLEVFFARRNLENAICALQVELRKYRELSPCCQEAVRVVDLSSDEGCWY